MEVTYICIYLAYAFIQAVMFCRGALEPHKREPGYVVVYMILGPVITVALIYTLIHSFVDWLLHVGDKQ